MFDLRRAARLPGRCFPVFMMFVLVSCSAPKKGPGGPAGGGFKMPPMPVEAIVVSRDTVRDQLNAVGTLEASEMITVVSEIAGTVTGLPFREGEPIGRGQLIAQIDDTELKARQDRAEAILAQSRQNFERARSLNERGILAQQDLEDAEASLKVAEADLALVKAQVAKTRIVAPFPGLVGSRKVSPGAFVHAGDPITELAQIDEMKMNFAAPERYLGRLSRGSAVTISAPAFPGEALSGQIDVIEPVLDPETRSVKVLARVKNPARLFRPGMSANVGVVLSERPDALTIPAEAVFVQGQQPFVYSIGADSTVAMTPVKLGTRTAEMVEVLDGVQPGVIVVRAGHQKLYPGAKVMPILPPPAAAPAAPAAPPSGAGS